MMFTDVYSKVEETSNYTAFSEYESLILYYELLKLGAGSNVVEIGVEWGRSTTIFGEIAKLNNFNHFCVDNFCEQDGKEQYQKFVERKEKYNWKNTKLFVEDSSKLKLGLKLDFLFIDGDHTYEGVRADINNWIDNVKRGSLVLFHDYNRDSLPGVKLAVSECSKIKFLAKIHSIGIFKKI